MKTKYQLIEHGFFDKFKKITKSITKSITKETTKITNELKKNPIKTIKKTSISITKLVIPVDTLVKISKGQKLDLKDYLNLVGLVPIPGAKVVSKITKMSTSAIAKSASKAVAKKIAKKIITNKAKSEFKKTKIGQKIDSKVDKTKTKIKSKVDKIKPKINSKVDQTKTKIKQSKFIKKIKSKIQSVYQQPKFKSDVQLTNYNIIIDHLKKLNLPLPPSNYPINDIVENVSNVKLKLVEKTIIKNLESQEQQYNEIINRIFLIILFLFFYIILHK